MSVLELPLFVDTPLVEYRVKLSTREYRIKFDYHEREDRWFLYLYEADGTFVTGPLKVVCGRPLLSRVRYRSNCPAGELVAIDRNGTLASPGASPGFYDLGRRVRLFYLADSSEPAVTSVPYVAPA